MRKIFIFTLMVIGYMSFTLSTNTHISSSTSTSEFNSQATSTVNSGAVNSALLATQASNASFDIGFYSASYVDPTTGQLYASGPSLAVGLGYNEDGNPITAQSFTPLIKSGDASQPFINPIDWAFGNQKTAIIDADGKVWTTGQQSGGGLGNGVIGDWTNTQRTFEEVIGLPEGYNAVKVAISEYVIVMLDDGTIWGAGNYAGLGLSSTGGVTTAGVEGGGVYPTMTQLDGNMPFDTSEIVDIKAGGGTTLYLLEDGSLYRCYFGYTLVGSDVISFDANYTPSMYVTTTGDVYFTTGGSATYTKILSSGEYEGTIDSIYLGGHYSTYSESGWAYLTNDGDVYYSKLAYGVDILDSIDLFKVAEDVIYLGMGGHNDVFFGAITKSGEFKLWGNDSHSSLGNGTTEGGTTITPENALDAFYSEEATPSTPTTDGNNVTPPAVDVETGELQKDEDGNNVAIIPTLSTPAPANFLKKLKNTLGKRKIEEVLILHFSITVQFQIAKVI